MENSLIKLRASARKAGIDGYGSMSAAELKSALDEGPSKRTGTKRKSASSVSKRKSASAVASPARKRGRPKGSTNKPTARKKAASNSEVELSERQAKRIVKKYEGKRGRRPAEFYQAQEMLGIENDAPKASTSKPKRKSAATATRRTRRASSANSNGNGGRNLIDKSSIDWRVEWSGGKTGNRAIIFKSLRKHKGNYQKVLAELKPNVMKMYGKSNKTGERYNKEHALGLLKWSIGRVAFDFVMDTGQHEKSTNRKPDKRTHGSAGARRSAARASDNGDVDVSDWSDAKLKRIVNKAAGQRGRKSAQVRAAIAELESRSEPVGRRTAPKSKARTASRQNRSGGRRGRSRATARKRTSVKR